MSGGGAGELARLPVGIDALHQGETPPDWSSRSDRLLGLSAFALSLVGVGLSTYMTIAHFTEAAILACAGGGELSCTAVTTSSQSEVVGVPVAVMGLAYFLALSVLTAPPLWKRGGRMVALIRTGLSIAGVAFVLWLVAAEVLIIGHVCLWCTGVHLVTLTILLALTRSTPERLGFGDAAPRQRSSEAHPPAGS